MGAEMSVDYGRCPLESGSLPNRDPETGIRYGIISLNELPWWAIDEFKPAYSASCPECGSDIDGDDNPESCPSCGYTPQWDDEWYRDEPDSLEYDCDGLVMVLDENNDVWIFKSPKTTSRWSHCSPCAPGAAYLDNGDGDGCGGLAYCLPDEWLKE
jgi:hypothetical protein